MKFNSAWAHIAAQNVTLKVATVTLALVAMTEAISIVGLLSRPALVVERACFDRPLATKSSKPTNDEIKSFLDLALSQRFDTSTIFKIGILSVEETANREKEQAALKERQMNQRVLISDVKFSGSDILVQADRIVGVGKIKSVLPLSTKVVLEQTDRSETNPYGLILSSIIPNEEKGAK